MSRVLIPVPSRDFDPTEVAVSWQVLTAKGHDVTFATPHGTPAEGDDIMVTGTGLDPWSRVPVLNRLTVIGRILRANADARRAYRDMIASPSFQKPIRWLDIDARSFDGLLLAGGHRARGMREYLESPILQRTTRDFFAAEKPVAAICHGVLLAARSKAANGNSVLHGRKTTSLTWAQESAATALGRIGRFWDPTYYRTYTEAEGQPAGFMSVQQEVTRALARPEDFEDVARSDPNYRKKTSGLARDTPTDDTPAFVVQDGNYISARWPGDAYSFAAKFATVLESAG